ncbi:hypothetical protein K2173_027411 [Erythroxylum novogranatense]|uniref:Uncharacterized protein n=1 Tax=Erythroxylum novogranatense TaxID=1862640 RepID=A0AAV8U1T3_9ROSI|nr:hypothetical protein K2173_027411 [Erythroxylum novogranatense]
MTNLAKAEEEVELPSVENCILDEEIKRLLRHHHRECNIDGSDGKHTNNTSVKRNKRKSSPKVSSPIEMKLDFKEVNSVRQPLSPLRHNSPDGRRMHKK